MPETSPSVLEQTEAPVESASNPYESLTEAELEAVKANTTESVINGIKSYDVEEVARAGVNLFAVQREFERRYPNEPPATKRGKVSERLYQPSVPDPSAVEAIIGSLKDTEGASEIAFGLRNTVEDEFRGQDGEFPSDEAILQASEVQNLLAEVARGLQAVNPGEALQNPYSVKSNEEIRKIAERFDASISTLETAGRAKDAEKAKALRAQVQEVIDGRRAIVEPNTTNPEVHPVNDEQDTRNLEILRQSDYGVVLERAYIEATSRDPRLEAVEIVALPKNAPSLARALPAWRSKNGKHQVEVALGNIDEQLHRIDETLKAIPGARKSFAEMMGISEDSLTPEAVMVFSFLHEIGHVTEFIDHEADPKALELRMKREKEALPIGKATVSAMLTEGTAAHKYVNEHWTEIASAYGLRNLGELLEKQHVAHWSMTSEAHANDFVTTVFALNPVMADQLISPHKEEFRHYPLAA